MRIKAETVIEDYRYDRLGKEAIKEIVKERLANQIAFEILKTAKLQKDMWFQMYTTKYTLELEVFTPLEYTKFLLDMQENCRQIIAAGILAKVEKE
jgi:hypothetical protein